MLSTRHFSGRCPNRIGTIIVFELFRRLLQSILICMPTYDYRRADGTVFEIFQPITADRLTHCPETGQPVQRLISGGTGFILKGSGFYQTDYAAEPAAKESPKGEKKEPQTTTNGTPDTKEVSVAEKNKD